MVHTLNEIPTYFNKFTDPVSYEVKLCTDINKIIKISNLFNTEKQNYNCRSTVEYLVIYVHFDHMTTDVRPFTVL